MRSTSAEYKVDIDKDFRNRSYCEVELDFIETITTIDEIESVRNQLDYSNTELVNHTPRQTISYATLEKDRIKLDGSTSVYFTTSIPFSCGFVSENLSDSNGEFEEGTQPMLDITFNEPTSFYGLTIWSDLFTEDKISDFRVITINSSSEEERMSVNGNESVACSINHDFKNITSIRIIIDKTNKPNMRARVPYIDFGIIKVYDNDSLMDDGVHFIDRTDPLSRELPEQSVEFTIDNYEHDFNIDNPNGIYNKITTNLPIKVRLGYELDSSMIEWINMGTYYLSEWNIETYKATFKAVGILNAMNDNYYSTFNTSSNTIPTFTISQLLSDIITNGSGITTYDEGILELFDTVSIQALLDIMPKNEVLQYISNMLNIVFVSSTEAYNNPQILAKGYNNIIDYNLNKDKYMEDTLNIELEENLKAVEVKYYKYSVDSTQQTIFSGNISVSSEDNEEYIYFDKPYGKVTYTSSVVSGNPSVSYSELTSTYAHFLFSGSGVITITVKGYTINKTENIYTLNVNSTGEVATFENPLVTNLSVAKTLANNIANYLTKREKYSLDYVGEPMLESTDTVNFENQFSSSLKLLITNNEITFNGGLTGKIEGKVV